MYRKDAKLSISLAATGSPSFLANNLSASKFDTLAYSRHNEVHIVHANGNSVMKFVMEKTRIFQVTFEKILGKDVLVVTSSSGVQVWSASSNSILFYFPLNSLPAVADHPEEEKFMRGIAVVDNYLCVGTSFGTLHALNAADVVQGSAENAVDFSLAFSLQPDHYPITAMASYQSILSVTNDSGAIFGYNSSEAFLQIYAFPGCGYPCTCLVHKDNVLIGGFSSGHIRLFRTDIQELAVEVTAHARPVTGLSLHPTLNMVVSCSQDQFLHVWEVPDFMSPSSRDMCIIYSDLLENRICTGAVFLNDDRICVASYDDDDLVVYEKEK